MGKNSTVVEYGLNIDCCEAKKLEKVEKLTQLAHHPEPVRDTASPTASLTASLDKPTASLEHKFKVGDRVAHSDLYTVAYNYHGEIVDMAEDEVQIRWDERAGKPNEFEFYKVSELRRLPD